MTEIVLTKTVSVDTKYINSRVRETIQAILEQQYGDKCSDIGFMPRDSIRIVRTGPGEIRGSQLNGAISYDVTFQALLINPAQESIVEGEVTNSNTFGLLAQSGPLDINVPRELHEDQAPFEGISIGDTIRVKVLKKKIFYGTPRIQVMGILAESDLINPNRPRGEPEEDVETDFPALTADEELLTTEAAEGEDEPEPKTEDEPEPKTEAEPEAEPEPEPEGEDVIA